MASNNDNKVMSAKEAIERFVKDDESLIIGNYTVGTCTELVYEVCRQGKKGFTLYSQSGILDVDVLINAGCVSRLVTTYVMRSGGKNGGGAVERALQAGTLEMEDYTNFNYNARIMAGMHGFTFLPVLEGVMATDLFRKRGFMGDDKYRVIDCPYTGRKILTVPAANPDVCIIHVQRADKFGNAQYWGAMGSVAAAALCSKKIIVSCEEIVEHDVIQASPHFTIIPAYRVNAVVEVPWGAHPTEVLGCYNRDNFFYGMFVKANSTADGAKAWMDEWVYGCSDREALLDRYTEKFGMGMLDRLKAKAYYSAPANYGSAFTSVWDETGHNRVLGITLEEVEKEMEERGCSMSKPYTLNELLIISCAKEIEDYQNIILGVGLPTTAGALAKALYAPHANLMMESGIIDFEPLVPLHHIADAHSCRGFSYSTDLFSAFTMTYRGFVDICFLGVGQIDKFGNLNTTCIGDYYQPSLRLPGSGGAADFISYAKRTVLTLRGGQFVEKLDYFTSPGYLDGGDSRDASGWFPKGSGPSMLLTTKGVFRFDPETKELYLAQIHPGVSVEDVRKDVPWDLKVSPDLSQTERPTDEEINFVRRFAPAEALGREAATELGIGYALQRAKERGKG